MNRFVRIGKSASIPLCVTALATSLLVGCSNGTGKSIQNPPAPAYDEQPAPVSGAAVKGPIINGTVTLYDLDPTAEDLKGEVITTGTTNGAAAIADLVIPLDVVRLTKDYKSHLYLLEVAGGTSLTSNTAPVINRELTIVTGQEATAGVPIYATPLTTLTLELARHSYAQIFQKDPTLGEDGAFEIAYKNAETGVKTAFGFSLLTGVSTELRLLSPMETNAASLDYRTAIEGTAAVVSDLRDKLLNKGIDVDSDSLLVLLADDLTDGIIDAKGSAGTIPELQQMQTDGDLLPTISQDPATLKIPGTTRPLSDLASVLVDELKTVAPDEVPDNTLPIPVPKPAAGGTEDDDGDGVLNQLDVFPNNPKESADTDGDCATSSAFNYSAADYLTTTAGNGCGDNSDYAPLDPSIQSICDDPSLSLQQKQDAGCTDSDGDGHKDVNDVFPANPDEWADSDNDCATILHYTQAQYDSPTGGNDCGDNVDRNICYDVDYTQTIAGLATGSYYTSGIKAHMDTTDGVVRVDTVRPEVLAYVSTSLVADAAFDVTYILNPAKLTLPDSYAIFHNCVDPNPAAPLGCSNLLSFPPDQPTPLVLQDANNDISSTMTGDQSGYVYTYRKYQLQTENKVVLNIVQHGDALPSTQSCPTNN